MRSPRRQSQQRNSFGFVFVGQRGVEMHGDNMIAVASSRALGVGVSVVMFGLQFAHQLGVKHCTVSPRARALRQRVQRRGSVVGVVTVASSGGEWGRRR